MGAIRERIKSLYLKLSPNYRSIRRVEKQLEELYILFNQRLDVQEKFFWYSHFTSGDSLDQSKKEFFRAMPKAEGSLRTVQMVGSYMLRQFKRICEENEITYWLSFGTLLGAARHEGFIPWDDDIDVSLLRKDFERLRSVLEKDDHFDLRSYYSEAGRCFIHKVVFYGCDDIFWLDIFIWDYADTGLLGSAETWRQITRLRAQALQEVTRTSKHLKKRYDHELLSPKDDAVLQTVFEKYRLKLPASEEPDCVFRSMDSVYLGGETLLPLSEIFPLVSLKFEGETYPVPCQYERYLFQVYHYLDFPKTIVEHRIEDLEFVRRVEASVRTLGLEEELRRMERRS